MRFSSVSISIFALAFISPLSAQVPSQQPAAGTVSGEVICSDTQQPARFATVTLYSVPKQITPVLKVTANTTGPQFLANLGAMQARSVQVKTDSEGNYIVSNVLPGDYYVFAELPGYVSPKDAVQAAYDAGADLQKPIPGIPVVHVAAGYSAAANVTMVRGAAVSGKILWEDGSAVPLAHVTVVRAKGADKTLPAQFATLGATTGQPFTSSISDDVGQYRVSGLLPGDYLVKVSLLTNAYVSNGGGHPFDFRLDTPFVIYAPSALHQASAKPVPLVAGENFTGEDVTISLAGMHSVSGNVISAEDNHAINSAKMTLQDTTDKDFSRSTQVDNSGHFTITLVPPGNYDLLVTDAEDTGPPKPGRFTRVTLASYGDGKQSVMVTNSDVTGVTVPLTSAK